MTKMLHATAPMVHIFRENQLDELICRTKGGWSTGVRRADLQLEAVWLDAQIARGAGLSCRASTQIVSWAGTVELTAEALTEYEFDDSPRGWRRSLEAWHLLMNAWGVKLPPGHS